MTRFVTDTFERTFAERLKVPHAIAVNSGTSALIAALWALDLQPGDEVVTTPYTFVATANAILIAGGRPVFADVDPQTLLLDPQEVERKISPRTRALLPVHLFGQVCPLDRFQRLAQASGLYLIEDTAQALGATWQGRYAGTSGDCGCFSFYKTKNLSTFEGGLLAVPANSRIDPIKLRAITTQGDVGGRQYEHLGFNFRMPEPCALLGLERLKFHWPAIQAELGRYGAQDGYYPRLVYQEPFYRRLGITGNCPIAEQAAARVSQAGRERSTP
jgi:dTDP-4-amino-4,6-dideoxygalactose transaminase